MKHLKLTFLFAILMSMVGAKANAAIVYTVNGIYYELAGKTAAVVVAGQTKYKGNIVIPASVSLGGTTCAVEMIRAEAFKDCTELTSVKIGNKVLSIGADAFSGCSALTSVTLGSRVKTIAEKAFYGCSALTTVTMGGSETTIGNYAFYQCDNLTSITLPEGLTTIGDWAFYGCDKLSSANIPSTVTTIGERAFNSCKALTSITIPKSVTSFGSAAFSSCKGLTSLTFEYGLTVIGENAFRHCDALTSVTIPGSIKEISQSVFDECLGLTEVTFENGVEIIGKSAFSECPNLTTINFPTRLKEISDRAFYGCTKLTSLTIDPSEDCLVGFHAFDSCTALTEVVLGYHAILTNSSFDNCTNVVSVTVKKPIPDKIGSNTFPNRANATLYVPIGCKAAYEAASYWNEFKKIVEPVTDISAIDNVIYMDNAKALAGTEATLSIKMKNTAPIRGFQFDLYLPEGVTVAKSSSGKIQGTLSAGRLPAEDEHTLTFSEQADGAIRFLCSSQYDETFTGNDGEVATLKVNVDKDIADGEYTIQMKGMKLTETDISKFYETGLVASHLTIATYVDGDISGDHLVDVSDYTGIANFIHGNPPAGFNEKAADVDKNGVIDVSDYTGIANIIHTGSIYGNSTNSARATGNQPTAAWDDKDNVIYIAPFTATAGAQTTLSIEMKNTAPIRGFQFDLYLPEGMTVVKSSKGRIQGALSAGRLPEDDEHDLTFSQQADGAIRFLCSSQYDENFTGNSGEIATLKVDVANDMSSGDYPIQLKTVKLTETDISKYYLTDLIESTVTIEGTATGIKAIDNGHLTIDDEAGAWYTLDGRKLAGKPAQKGVYIVNGKKVTVK